MRIFKRAISLFGMACAGCVALTSELNDSGVVYYLPKSILTVTVTEYHDTTNGRKWYQLGGEVKYLKDTVTPIPGSQLQITSDLVPDPRHRYVIKYRPSKLSDDRLCISRKQNGLLNDVQFASDDRTPQIAFNIARFLAGAFGGERQAGISQQDATAGTLSTRSYTGKLDPFEPHDVHAFKVALRRVFGPKAGLRLSFDRMHDLVEQIKRAQGTAAVTEVRPGPHTCKVGDRACLEQVMRVRCSPEDICYRTKLSFPVDLLQHEHVVDATYAEIVNAEDIGAISVTRAFLVHKLTKLRFQDGVLTAAIVRKPSEVEELSLMPLHVVNAALSTPTGLWNTAFNGSNESKQKVLDAMASLDQKVSQLQTQQKELMKSLESGTPGVAIGSDISYTLDCTNGAGSTVVPVVNYVPNGGD